MVDADLLELLTEHARQTIDAGKYDQTPDADETVLHILADAVRTGERVTPQEILQRAQEADGTTFRNWHPRTVTARLKAYGIPTPKKTMSRREFRDVTPETLRRIQAAYGIDLDFPNDEETIGDGP
jgi:hypothetical protein